MRVLLRSLVQVEPSSIPPHTVGETIQVYKYIMVSCTFVMSALRTLERSGCRTLFSVDMSTYRLYQVCFRTSILESVPE